MEKDDELKGSGNSYDFGARIYDSRVGRFLSRDPDEARYPQWSTYNAFVCNPILFVDPTGRGAVVTKVTDENGKVTAFVVTATIYVYSSCLNQQELALAAQKIQNDIETQWCNPINLENGEEVAPTTRYMGKDIPVVFNVTVIVMEEKEAEEQFNKGIFGDNFIEIVENQSSYFKGNTGRINIHDLYNRGTSTSAHEFGHLVGYLNNSTYLYEWDKTHTCYEKEPGGIMTVPFSAQMEETETLNEGLSKRQVSTLDYTRIDNGKGITGGFSAKKESKKIGTNSEKFK